MYTSIPESNRTGNGSLHIKIPVVFRSTPPLHENPVKGSFSKPNQLSLELLDFYKQLRMLFPFDTRIP